LSSIGDKTTVAAKAQSDMASWHIYCYYHCGRGIKAMKKGLIKIAPLCALIILCFGCNSVTGPDHNPTVRTVTTYQGTWEGTTSEGFSVKFTVTGNTVMSFLIEMLTVIPNKPAEKIAYSANGSVIIAETDFTIQVYNSPSAENSIVKGIPISGHFTSTATIEGISVPEVGSGVTWSAGKK
jgi:hypothetical protein